VLAKKAHCHWVTPLPPREVQFVKVINGSSLVSLQNLYTLYDVIRWLFRLVILRPGLFNLTWDSRLLIFLSKYFKTGHKRGSLLVI
jgi:hypothetical protein